MADDKEIIKLYETADGGYAVRQIKTRNGSDVLLATFCGGNLGRIFASKFAKEVAEFTMADEIDIEMSRESADRLAALLPKPKGKGQ